MANSNKKMVVLISILWLAFFSRLYSSGDIAHLTSFIWGGQSSDNSDDRSAAHHHKIEACLSPRRLDPDPNEEGPWANSWLRAVKGFNYNEGNTAAVSLKYIPLHEQIRLFKGYSCFQHAIWSLPVLFGCTMAIPEVYTRNGLVFDLRSGKFLDMSDKTLTYWRFFKGGHWDHFKLHMTGPFKDLAQVLKDGKKILDLCYPKSNVTGSVDVSVVDGDHRNSTVFCRQAIQKVVKARKSAPLLSPPQVPPPPKPTQPPPSKRREEANKTSLERDQEGLDGEEGKRPPPPTTLPPKPKEERKHWRTHLGPIEFVDLHEDVVFMVPTHTWTASQKIHEWMQYFSMYWGNGLLKKNLTIAWPLENGTARNIVFFDSLIAPFLKYFSMKIIWLNPIPTLYFNTKRTVLLQQSNHEFIPGCPYMFIGRYLFPKIYLSIQSNASHPLHNYTKIPGEDGYLPVPKKLCILKSGKGMSRNRGAILISDSLQALLESEGFTVISDTDPIDHRMFFINQAEMLLTTAGSTHTIHSLLWGGNHEEGSSCQVDDPKDTENDADLSSTADRENDSTPKNLSSTKGGAEPGGSMDSGGHVDVAEEKKRKKEKREKIKQKQKYEVTVKKLRAWKRDRPPLRYICFVQPPYEREFTVWHRMFQHRIFRQDGLWVAVTNASTWSPPNCWMKFLELGGGAVTEHQITRNHLRFEPQDCYLEPPVIVLNESMKVLPWKDVMKERPEGVYHTGTGGSKEFGVGHRDFKKPMCVNRTAASSNVAEDSGDKKLNNGTMAEGKKSSRGVFACPLIGGGAPPPPPSPLPKIVKWVVSKKLEESGDPNKKSTMKNLMESRTNNGVVGEEEDHLRRKETQLPMPSMKKSTAARKGEDHEGEENEGKKIAGGLRKVGEQLAQKRRAEKQQGEEKKEDKDESIEEEAKILRATPPGPQAKAPTNLIRKSARGELHDMPATRSNSSEKRASPRWVKESASPSTTTQLLQPPTDEESTNGTKAASSSSYPPLEVDKVVSPLTTKLETTSGSPTSVVRNEKDDRGSSAPMSSTSIKPAARPSSTDAMPKGRGL